MNKQIRIALVEDDTRYRRRVAALIAGHPRWTLVAEYGRAEGVVERLPPLDPHLVLLDIRLPGTSGLDILRPLRRELPRAALAMLTVVEQTNDIVSAFENGASAYLLKRGPASKFIADIEDIAAGGASMSPAVALRVIAWFAQQGGNSESNPHPLTPREWQVLHLAARGRHQGEIALELGIAVNTVKNHCRHIYEKLGVHSMREALVTLNRGHSLLGRYGIADQP